MSSQRQQQMLLEWKAGINGTVARSTSWLLVTEWTGVVSWNLIGRHSGLRPAVPLGQWMTFPGWHWYFEFHTVLVWHASFIDKGFFFQNISRKSGGGASKILGVRKHKLVRKSVWERVAHSHSEGLSATPREVFLKMFGQNAAFWCILDNVLLNHQCYDISQIIGVGGQRHNVKVNHPLLTVGSQLTPLIPWLRWHCMGR